MIDTDARDSNLLNQVKQLLAFRLLPGFQKMPNKQHVASSDVTYGSRSTGSVQFHASWSMAQLFLASVSCNLIGETRDQFALQACRLMLSKLANFWPLAAGDELL